jgi:hypothetical protein
MKETATNDSRVKEKALDLIALHIGDITAQMYANFYRKKSDAFVMNSLEDLMASLLGKSKAMQEIKKIK